MESSAHHLTVNSEATQYPEYVYIDENVYSVLQCNASAITYAGKETKMNIYDSSARPKTEEIIKIGSETSLSGSGSKDRTEASRHGANVRPRDQLFEFLRSWEPGSFK